MTEQSEVQGAQPRAADVSGPTSPGPVHPGAPAPLPVTDVHVRQAWFDFYERPPMFGDLPILPPEDPNMWKPELTLNGLRRVLEADRRRVIEEQSQ